MRAILAVRSSLAHRYEEDDADDEAESQSESVRAGLGASLEVAQGSAARWDEWNASSPPPADLGAIL